ncbi:MAG: hypothetical protein ACOC0Z_08515 [Halohasta sp.]
MSDVTLLELHVPDGDIQLGPKSLSRGSTGEASEPSTESAPSDGGGSKRRLLLGIVLVGALAFAMLRALSEGPDEDLAEFDDT